MTQTPENLTVGQRVVVIQQIPQGDSPLTIRTQGIVEKLEQRKTGSWYAHAKDDKLWLDRLVLRKDDGEIVVFNLDHYSRVEALDSQGLESAES